MRAADVLLLPPTPWLVPPSLYPDALAMLEALGVDVERETRPDPMQGILFGCSGADLWAFSDEGHTQARVLRVVRRWRSKHTKAGEK